MNIMDAIKNESADTNLTRTENGALGYANCRSAIVDFFYKISTFRQETAEQKQTAFLKALAEDKDLAYRMLFFARDIRKGLGERQLFRDIFKALDPKVAKSLVKLIPEYGRWDDVIDILRNEGIDQNVSDETLRFIQNQFAEDLKNYAERKPISLLAKWMPSIRKVSKDKVRMAKFLAHSFEIPERKYRKALSVLRAHLKVVEKQMSEGKWGEIDFGSVPSKAAKNYRGAFMKHDEARYREYLGKLEKGEAKVNAGAVFPYEIVSAYRGGYESPRGMDVLLENQWKALPLPKGLLENAIVVRDGSGSMMVPVSGKSTALDVATSLAVLTSEHLKGPFKNRFITFSRRPKFVDFGGCHNLQQKLQVAFSEAECANTDIELTMDLILNAALKNGLKQEEIPTVVIISDMEFDEARGSRHYWSDGGEECTDERNTLFESIRSRWAAAGYKLPKMVFWNVNSRTATVPMQENDNGLILVSGFSQNIMDMLAGNGSMLDIIRKKLNVPRYDCVTKALSGLDS